MPEQSIDSVVIEISTESNAAAQNLNAVASALGRLNANSRLTRTINNLTKLTAAVRGMNGLESAANSITRISTAIQGLASVQKLSGLTSAVNTLSKLPAAIAGINPGVLQGLANAVQPLSTAFESLGSVEKLAGLNSAINTLGKLPQVAAALREMDLGAFAAQMQQLSDAMAPLAANMSQVASGFAALPKNAQRAMNAVQKFSTTATSATKQTSSLGSALASLFGNFSLAYVANKAWDILGSALGNFNDYVENVNLFRVSMGDLADEATEATQKMEDVLGVDSSAAMRNMGVIQNLVTSFGLASDQAYVLSENLTQLGYDMSSFFNISIEDSFQKLQAAISGELEPIRRLGVDISEARLQQELYERGIDATVSSLNQADKAILRYIAIMEQTTNAQTDMARTLNSPANQIRVFQQQVTLLARSIGSLLIPMLNAILPPLIAVVQVIREAIQAIASFFGIEVSFADATTSAGSSLGGVSSGIEDVGSSAAAASEEVRELIGGFDELNVLPDPTSGSGGGGAGGGGSILGDLELPSYDMFDGLSDRVNDLADKIKNAFKRIYDVLEPFIPILKGIAAAIAAAFVVTQLAKFWKALKNIASTNAIVSGLFNALRAGALGFTTAFENGAGLLRSFKDGLMAFRAAIPLWAKIATVVATSVGSFVTAYDAAYKCQNGMLSLGEAVANTFGAFALFGTIAYLVAGPIGLIVTGVATLAGSLLGARQAIMESAQAAYEGSEEYLILNQVMEETTEISERCATGQENLKDKLSSLDSTVAQYSSVRTLVDDIFALSENTHKSAAECVELRAKVDLLNNMGIDGLTLSMNNAGDAIEQTRGEVYSLIDSLEEAAYQAALQDALTEAYKQQLQAQLDLQTAMQDNSVATDQYNAATQALNEYMSQQNGFGRAWIALGMDKTYDALKMTADDAASSVESSNSAVQAAKDLYDQSTLAADTYSQTLADLQSGTTTVKDIIAQSNQEMGNTPSVTQSANDAISSFREEMGVTQNAFSETANSASTNSAQIASSYAAAYDSAKSAASDSAQEVANQTENTTGALRNGSTAMQGVASSYAAAYGNVNRAASDSARNVSSAAQEAATNLSNNANSVNGTMGQLASQASGWGSDLVSGFVNGIQSMWKSFTGKIDELGNYIWSHLHFSRPEVGPLRDYETWMPDMVKGLARSLEQKSYILQDAVEGLSAQASVSLNAMMDTGSVVAPGAARAANPTASGSDDSAAILMTLTQMLQLMQEDDVTEVNVDGGQLLRVVKRRAAQEQMRTGKNPFMG